MSFQSIEDHYPSITTAKRKHLAREFSARIVEAVEMLRVDVLAAGVPDEEHMGIAQEIAISAINLIPWTGILSEAKSEGSA